MTRRDYPWGFTDQQGNPFMKRCPKCGRENYAPMVATGSCAWCHYTITKEDCSDE